MPGGELAERFFPWRDSAPPGTLGLASDVQVDRPVPNAIAIHRCRGRWLPILVLGTLAAFWSWSTGAAGQAPSGREAGTGATAPAAAKAVAPATPRQVPDAL